jgi:hypothetical protein
METSTGSLAISTSPVRRDRLEIPPPRRQGADVRRFIHYLPSGRGALGRPERTRADVQHRARRNVAAHVRAHLAAELLADGFEPIPFHALDIHHVRQVGGVHFDGKPRREIHAEVRVRNQHDTARGHDAQQCLADQFGVGIRQRLLGDLPDLAVGTPQALADLVQIGAPAGDDRRAVLGGVDLRAATGSSAAVSSATPLL